MSFTHFNIIRKKPKKVFCYVEICKTRLNILNENSLKSVLMMGVTSPPQAQTSFTVFDNDHSEEYNQFVFGGHELLKRGELIAAEHEFNLARRLNHCGVPAILGMTELLTIYCHDQNERCELLNEYVNYIVSMGY